MILILDSLNMHRFPTLMEDMFQLRSLVFGGRFGWPVNISSGKEIDQFSPNWTMDHGISRHASRLSSMPVLLLATTH